MSKIGEGVKALFGLRGQPGVDVLDFVSPSFPKTGNTWIRYLLGQYVAVLYRLGEAPLFDGAEREAMEAQGYCGSYGAFTHGPLTWETQTAADLTRDNCLAPYERVKVLLLSRHPLDVMVSLYMQEVTRTQKYAGSISSFIEDKVFGLSKYIAYYNLWANRVVSHDNILLVHYEGMRQDAVAGLMGITRFLGIPWDEESAAVAVERSSFSSMRKLELSGRGPKYKSSGLSIFATGDIANPEAMHLRRGEVKGYRHYLDAVTTDSLIAMIKKNLAPCYGYCDA